MALEPIKGEPQFLHGNAVNFAKVAAKMTNASTLFNSIHSQNTNEAYFFRTIRTQFRQAEYFFRKLHTRFDEAATALETYSGVLAEQKEKAKRASERWDIAQAEIVRLAAKQAQATMEAFASFEPKDPTESRRIASDLEYFRNEQREAERLSKAAHEAVKDAAKIAGHAFRRFPKASGIRDAPGEGAYRREVEEIKQKEQFWRDWMDNTHALPWWVDILPGGAVGRAFAGTVGIAEAKKRNDQLEDLGVTPDYDYWMKQIGLTALDTASAGVGMAAGKFGPGRVIPARIRLAITRRATVAGVRAGEKRVIKVGVPKALATGRRIPVVKKVVTKKVSPNMGFVANKGANFAVNKAESAAVGTATKLVASTAVGAATTTVHTVQSVVQFVQTLPDRFQGWEPSVRLPGGPGVRPTHPLGPVLRASR